MADEIAAPRPLTPSGRDGRLARALLALEVPDCGCRLGRLCLRLVEQVRGSRAPRPCPGKDKCRECPPAADLDNPCPHVAAVLDRHADATPAELAELERRWLTLLWAYDAEGYAERPEPPPDVAVSREARVALYARRAERGYGLFARGDVVGGDALDRAAVQGASCRDTGRIVTGRGEAG